MPPTPSPSPVHVIVDSGAAEWWQILAALGPLAILLGALLAAFIGWNTLRQRTIADSRAEWWKRTQWALDQALAKDKDTKALGLATLAVLTRSELARKEELELLDIAWKSVNGTAESDDEKEPADDSGVMDSADNISDNGTTSGQSEEGKQ